MILGGYVADLKQLYYKLFETALIMSILHLLLS